jgi:hypothetical protein
MDRIRHGAHVGAVEAKPLSHYFEVDGRKWRATDPGIPEKLRQELVNELMAARRLVKTDPGRARPRVNDAKVALGERGYKWWEQPTPTQLATRIEATVRALLRHRDGRTICPSDVARVLGGDQFRPLMDAVRSQVAAMVADGHVRVLQRGQEVDLASAKGPIRIALAPGASRE